jgi:Tat protein secretion system quality control protein TatD with DNase activity
MQPYLLAKIMQERKRSDGRGFIECYSTMAWTRQAVDSRNWPWIANTLAACRDETLEQLAELTTANARRFFKIERGGKAD